MLIPALLHRCLSSTLSLLLGSALFLILSDLHAQDASSADRGASRAAALMSASPNVSAAPTVGLTNSIDALNDKAKLGAGDRLSYRVVEERRDPIPLVVTDSGEVEVPFIGRVPATGKTCKELALMVKPLLEKEYFFKATVIIGLDALSMRSRGKVYLTGQVRQQGAFDIPADETLTVSKVILRAGGLGDFANRKKVRLVRRLPDGKSQTIYVDLAQILDKGDFAKDPVIQADDVISVPERLINF